MENQKEDLFKIKNQIIKTIRDNIDIIVKNGNSTNIHNCHELKIVLVGNLGNHNGEYHPSDNFMLINIGGLITCHKSIEEILASIESTVSHEFRHVEQVDYFDKTRHSSAALSFDCNHANLLNEASATSSLTNLNIFTRKDKEPDDFTYSYKYYRDLENQLFFCSVFDNNKTLDKYYTAITNRDNNGILEFLGATNQKEKRELLRVIYAINSLAYNSKTGSYNTDYLANLTHKKTHDWPDDTDIYKMTDNIKFLHYITIIKYSLRGLINYNLESVYYNSELSGLNDIILDKSNNFVKKDRLSLEENVFLYYLIVSRMANYSCVIMNNVRSYYADFLNEYKSMEESYFKILSVIYKADINTIRTIFLSYNSSNIDYELGCYYGNVIGDEYFKDAVHQNQDIIKAVLSKFPKLKYTAFLEYRRIKEKYFHLDGSAELEVLESVINKKNTYANYTVRNGR